MFSHPTPIPHPASAPTAPPHPHAHSLSPTRSGPYAPYAQSPGEPARLPSSVPPRCAVPDFAPLKVRGGGALRLRFRRALHGRQRVLAAGFALTAAALAASGLGVAGLGLTEGSAAAGPGPERPRPPVRLVSAPVRIADAATVRLLRPGDRVDVIAAPASGGDARVLARDVRVTRLPGSAAGGLSGPGAEETAGWSAGAEDPGGGALVVLSVTRETAVALAGAHTSGELAVAVSDAAVPDATVPDSTVPDAAVPDAAVPDVY